MSVIEVLVFIAGLGVVFWVLSAALRTVVVPRGEDVLLTRVMFRSLRAVNWRLARLRRSDERREAVLARFGPTGLMLLPAIWATGVIVGFSLLFWALDVRPYREALILSGSSLTTLGFRTTDDLPTVLLAIAEAVIGLGLVALLISFLPTIYGAFSRREAAVARLEVRAGAPPDPEQMILRAHRIGWLDDLDDTWAEWEDWFIHVEETHVTYPALNYFRSNQPHTSWLTAAGCALDTASIVLSSVEVERSPRASLCVRAGYTALRRICDFMRIEYDPDPAPTAPIAVTRNEFYELYERLAAARVPMKPDREQAWLDFSGWRVNYDQPLLGLCWLVSPPEARWSSDRAAGR